MLAVDVDSGSATQQDGPPLIIGVSRGRDPRASPAAVLIEKGPLYL